MPVLALLAATGMALGGPAGPAGAATTVQVTGGSWYYAGQTPSPPVVGQPAKSPTPEVPDTDFPVAAAAGQSNKETYLHIDTAAIPAGSTVASLKLVLSEDAAASSVAASLAGIVAEPVTGFFVDGTKAAPYSERPSVDASVKAKGTRAADGTWTFDITAIANRWVSGQLANNGVALVPSGDPGQSFEVVWAGASPPPTTEGQVVPPAGASEQAAGGSGQPGTSPSGGLAAAGPTQPIEPDFATPVTAPTQLSPAAPPGAATVTGGATAGGATGKGGSAAAGRHRTGHASPAPPPAFWLGLAALVALVAAGAVALGDRGEPAPARQGSVLAVLERRRAARPPGGSQQILEPALEERP
jgi:hypothetical protein